VKITPLVLAMCMLLFLIPTSFASGYIDLTVVEAKGFVGSNPSWVVLGVRTQVKYLSGHIRNARHIPGIELEGRLGELGTTSKILVYCSVGGRSATANHARALTAT
jgi:rhodanese-related sulfurtransferase